MALRAKNAFRSRRSEVRLYRKRIIASGISALFILLVGFAVWYGTRQPQVTIASIEVVGGSTVPHDSVVNKANGVLSGTYAFLIPKRFAYLYPKEELLDGINSIPRVHNASVERISATALKATFDEYVPYALWCDSASMGTSTTASCLFVDAEGYAYAEAPPLQGETLVRLVAFGRKPELGVYVYGADTLANYRVLSDAIFLNHSHRVKAITETNPEDLTLHLSGDVDLLIAKDADVQEIYETIESLFTTEEFEGLEFESLEYIDLRFGNKVYVKQDGAGEDAEEFMATTTESIESLAEPEAE